MVHRYGRDIPEFVKRFREDYNLSQADLGRMLGVHKQYVSNVERGVNDNPIGFLSLMYAVIPKTRIPYLTDLISEASSGRALRKFNRAKKIGSRRELKDR